jgi:hypothetical protein
LNEGIVGTEQFVARIQQVSIYFSIQLLHQLQIPGEFFVLNGVYRALFHE